MSPVDVGVPFAPSFPSCPNRGEVARRPEREALRMLQPVRLPACLRLDHRAADDPSRLTAPFCVESDLLRSPAPPLRFDTASVALRFARGRRAPCSVDEIQCEVFMRGHARGVTRDAPFSRGGSQPRSAPDALDAGASDHVRTLSL